VTVMVDPGAEFKMFHSEIDVGSSAQNLDRSEGALQVLGVPGNQVIFTSFNDNSVGGTTESPPTAPARGDWGGIVFRNDSDLEPLGIFLNYVDEATIRYGGGQVNVNGTPTNFDSVTLQSSRPTVTNNTIVDSADAPISANPNSFEETHFGQDITLLAPSGDKVVDGQTFQIHGTTFEFDNLNSPATIGVLPGDVAIGYYGTPINDPSPQPVDTAVQLATRIAAAINGAQLGQPALIQGSGSQTAQTASLVQAAVTGNQVTITNVAMNSSVALQVPGPSAPAQVQAGQTFAVKGTLFQFFSGDALKINASTGKTVRDGDVFTIKSGASGAAVTFEFALNGRAVIDGAWPVNYTTADSTDTLGREISGAIDAAQAAGAFAKAPLGTWAAAAPT